MSDHSDEEMTPWLSPIANPMVGGKLKSRTLKLLKKASSAKQVRRGVPEVTKALRKGKKGVILMGGDVAPIDVIAHVPILAEEKDVLYAFVDSRKELGAAIGSKRPVSVCLVHTPTDDSTFEGVYEQVSTGLRAIHPFMGSTTESKKEKE